MDISSEQLAYWFLRLNGFMTLYNFIVHPDQADVRGNYLQRTDVDVIGVRFPYREEIRNRPMTDHEAFNTTTQVQLVLAETKTRRCGFNASWREPDRENMQKILSATGFLPADEVEDAAIALYKHGSWSQESKSIVWAAFGSARNQTLEASYPGAIQLTWNEQVLPFIYARFRDYAREKRMHDQWDADAKGLFRAALDINDIDGFITSVTIKDPKSTGTG